MFRERGLEVRGEWRNKTRIFQAQVPWNKATRRPPRVNCDGSAPTIVCRKGREFLFRLVFAT